MSILCALTLRQLECGISPKVQATLHWTESNISHGVIELLAFDGCVNVSVIKRLVNFFLVYL